MAADHLTIARAMAFVERHGYALLFWWVLAEQAAIPLPSAPLLLAGGALIRTGKLHALPAIGCCVTAALIADTTWFRLGRVRGRRILSLLCRVSLEPDSCVHRTEHAFLKYGMASLLVAKFIPGLNAVAAPLAGDSKASYWRFLLYDTAGISIWAGLYLGVGYLFTDQLETIAGYAARMGSSLFALTAGLFLVWIGWKFAQRRRALKLLDGARIEPKELQDRMNAGEDLFIVDLRSESLEPTSTIPGALRISADDLMARIKEIPRDREIILYCS
jgi:membrane protein DedA with SNARE-associated domain